MNKDPLIERYQDFLGQEAWLSEQIQKICNRAVDETRMTRCQVAGVLMDLAMSKLGRPANFSDDNDEGE